MADLDLKNKRIENLEYTLKTKNEKVKYHLYY